MKIAIQGIEGSYHHQVATSVFGTDIQIHSCNNFSEIPQLLVSKTAHKGVMAIENTIAGAILPNYALINEYNLQICGEYYLPIHHQLLALKGQNFNDIKEVRSHPMAIEQCRKFFRKYPDILLIEGKDTAQVAKEIHDKKLTNIAAIASKNAAMIYGLDIIYDEIQTNKANYTRFVIVSKKGENAKLDYNKASLRFTLGHEIGSLLKILQIFKDYDINMTKIQSLPIVEKPWEYAFFTDIILTDPNLFEQATHLLKNHTKDLNILGKYMSNKHIDE